MNIEVLEEERAAKRRRKREFTASIKSTVDVDEMLLNQERELKQKRDRLGNLGAR